LKNTICKIHDFNAQVIAQIKSSTLPTVGIELRTSPPSLKERLLPVS